MLSGRLGGVQTGDFGEAAFARASSSINSFSCFNISFFSSFFFGLILTCNFFFFFRAFLTLIVHADSAIVCRHIANQTLYTNFNCLCCGLNHSQASPISFILWFAFNTRIQKNPLFCFHIECRLKNKQRGRPGNKAAYAAPLYSEP